MTTTLSLISDNYGPISVAAQVENKGIQDGYLETTLKFQTNDGANVSTLDFSFFGDVDGNGALDLVEQIATERLAVDNLVEAVLAFQRQFNEVANAVLKEVRA